MATEKSNFLKLYEVDATDRMFQKQGLNYLPWATAYSEVLKVFPDTTYEICKFGEKQVPYVADETGIMVFTKVTVEGITREMCLPVMNSSNKAMKLEAYEANGKTIAPATMFDVNKTIMRCLAKNLAMFGLGIHLWSKEDAPENVIESERLHKDIMELIKKRSELSPDAATRVANLCKELLPEENGDPRLSTDVSTLTDLKKKLMAIRK
jgi:hypothetical protein